MPDVASLQVVVSADVSQAETGLANLGTKVNSAGSMMATAFGGAAVAGIIGLGAAFATSVASAADFEKQMSAVSAVSGASAEEMQSLTQAALQLGKDTSFSASEAAQGIEELVKAGVGIQDVLGGAGRAALDLAAAGAISVADAAEIASNALNVFNLEGADMGHVADVIAGAANASAISVNDYKFSLSAAGAVAAAVGIGFEDLSTAIAVMGQAGIKGSDAGTSLKTMMMNLIPGTKKQTELFRELGIVTAEGANRFFDAEGKAKSFAEIGQVLQDALRGMTKEQQLATLETMFGSDAIRAGVVIMEAGAQGFEDMAAAMAKVTAQQVAEERLNNLWGSLEKLKGSLETGAIILGSMFTPALKGMVDVLTESVNQGITVLEELGPVVGETANAFSAQLGPAAAMVASIFTGQLWPALQGTIGFLVQHNELVAGIVAAFATFMIINTVVGWITGLVAAWGALSAAITASGGIIAAIVAVIGGPLTIILAAVALAIGLLTAAWIGNWFGIQEATQSAIDFIVPYIQQALASIEQFWATHGDTIMTVLTAVWDIVVAQITTAIAVISGLITAAVQLWNGDWSGAWQTMTEVATAIWNGWVSQLQAIMTILGALFGPAWAAITTTIQTALNTIGTTITGIWTGITTTIQSALTTIQTTITTAWQGIVTFITSIGEQIRSAVLAIWNQIPEDIRADLELITGHLTESGAAWVESVVSAGVEMAAALVSSGAEMVAAVTTSAAEMTASLVSAAAEWVASVTTAGAEMLASITASLASMLSEVTTWATSFLAPLTGLIGTATAAMQSVGQGMLSAISSALSSVISEVQSWASEVVGIVRGLAGQVAGAAQEVGRSIASGIASGLSAGAGAIRSAAMSAARSALNAAKSSLGIDSPSTVFRDEVGVQMAEGVVVGLGSMRKDVLGAMQGLLTPPATPSMALSSTVPMGRSGGGDVAGLVVNVNVYGSALASRQEIADAVVVGLAAAQQQGRTRLSVV